MAALPSLATTKRKTTQAISAASLFYLANGLVTLIQDVASPAHAFTSGDKTYVVSVIVGILFLVSPLAGITVNGSVPLLGAPAATTPTPDPSTGTQVPTPGA